MYSRFNKVRGNLQRLHGMSSFQCSENDSVEVCTTTRPYNDRGAWEDDANRSRHPISRDRDKRTGEFEAWCVGAPLGLAVGKCGTVQHNPVYIRPVSVPIRTCEPTNVLRHEKQIHRCVCRVLKTYHDNVNSTWQGFNGSKYKQYSQDPQCELSGLKYGEGDEVRR